MSDPGAGSTSRRVVVELPEAEEVVAPDADGEKAELTRPVVPGNSVSDATQLEDQAQLTNKVWLLNKENEMADAVRAEERVRRAVLEHAVERLEHAYHMDIDYCADWLLWFRRVADMFEWLSLVLSGLSSVLAYLAGVLTNRWWAFTAGIVGTVALGVAAIGRYCNAQSKERTSQLNKLLGRFGVPAYPDVVVEFTAGELQDIKQSGTSKNMGGRLGGQHST